MRRFLLACALFALPTAAQAQRTLTIAAQSAPTAMDRHFHRSNSNNAVLRHVFDPLVDFDAAGRIVPRLTESWRAVDDLTWEFRLRENLRFHDGTPLGLEDIAFSFARLSQVPNSPGSFASAGFSMYASARAGASGLAQALGKELGAANIQVNAVAPNFLSSETYYPKARWTDDPKYAERLKQMVPMQRLGRPEEVGALIAFLASGKADFVTAQVIPFTGGWP